MKRDEPLKSDEKREAEREQDMSSATFLGLASVTGLAMKHSFNGLDDWPE